MARGSNSWITSTTDFVAAFTAADDGGARVVKVKANSGNSEDLLVRVTDTRGVVTSDILEAGEKEYYASQSDGIALVEVKSAGGTAEYVVAPVAKVV